MHHTPTGITTPTTTPTQDTTTDRINQALHVLQLALSESGRSNYNRWQVKDAIDQLTAGDVPAAITALKKAVARQQVIERGVRLVEIDEGQPEAAAAAQALAILAGTDSADADVLALHTQACNALATALHHLRGDGCIKTATARAIRAATALKRLSALNMADMDSTPTPAARRPRTIKTKTAREPVAAYGTGDGVLSFRHGLTCRERGTIDRALAIVGRTMTGTRAAFDTPDAVKHYLQLQLAGEAYEVFAVLFLDVQNRLIAFERLFSGTLTQTSVYPREVVLAALGHQAAAVVLAHNHPSGSVQPSRADELLTQTLKTTLALVDVRVLDHVIVAPSEALSMAERGLL